GENLRDVVNAKGLLLAAQQTIEMHETRDIHPGDHLCPRLHVVGKPVPAHGAGHRLLLDREQPPEPAALVGTGKLDQGDALERSEQCPDLVEGLHQTLGAASQTELAERVTALVQPHPVWEATGDGLDFKDVHQELAQLESPPPDCLQLRTVGEYIPVMVS